MTSKLLPPPIGYTSWRAFCLAGNAVETTTLLIEADEEAADLRAEVAALRTALLTANELYGWVAGSGVALPSESRQRAMKSAVAKARAQVARTEGK